MLLSLFLLVTASVFCEAVSRQNGNLIGGVRPFNRRLLPFAIAQGRLCGTCDATARNAVLVILFLL
jgi:hypothetical protein